MNLVSIQIGDGVRAGGDEPGFAADGNFQLQHFGGRECVGATPKIVHAANHSHRVFVCEAQQRLLHLHEQFALLVHFARGAREELVQNRHGTLQHAAVCAEREEQEA